MDRKQQILKVASSISLQEVRDLISTQRTKQWPIYGHLHGFENLNIDEEAFNAIFETNVNNGCLGQDGDVMRALCAEKYGLCCQKLDNIK